MSLFARVGDLSDETVDELLHRAKELASGAAPLDHRGRVVSLLFLDTSLRTRVGFAAAAARLGAATTSVESVRGNPLSMPESWQDTLRIVAGYTDVCVARVLHGWAHEALPAGVEIPVISGGDVGELAEHPSQALLDVFAMERLVGPLSDLHVAVVGDLRMRAVRSLTSLLSMRRPARLSLVTDPALRGTGLPAGLEPHSYVCLDELAATAGVDVLYVAGMPHQALPEADRSRLRVSSRHLTCLSARGGVFSPLPIIDEWEPDVASHPRQRAWEQSDLALFVRMALLEWALAGNQPQRIS